MFGLQGNYWIWILLAFFLLWSNDGCGFDLNFGNILGGGNNTMLIIGLLAIYLIHTGSFAC